MRAPVPSSLRKLLLAAVIGELLCPAGLALAQEAAPAKPPAAPATAQSGQGKTVVPSVTVSAERPTNRIDRQVYDVKSDASSTNGSAADALNNVSSVSVDPDGTVSLRGSTHVQIYVDGKPSAMLQGDNRGPSLQAMPSEDIDSIEVINNPGAEFGNESGGGPTNDQNGLDRYITFGDGGTSASDYQRTTRRGGDSRNYAASTHWDHKGERRGETFKLDLRVSSSDNNSATDYANAYTVRPAGARDSASSQGNGNSTKITDFTGDYERPDDIGMLKLGFKVFETKTGA